MLSTRKILLSAAVAYSLAIGLGSLIHPPQILEGSPENSDKLVHASAYFGLCFIWFNYLFYEQYASDFKKALYIAMCGSLIYGTIIEILQAGLTSYRSGDFYDLLANATGILLAALAIIYLKNPLTRIKSKF